MPSASPTTAPPRARRGRSGSLGGGGGGAGGGGGGPAMAGANARRDGRKIGRSRVAVSDFRGTAHNGLPRGSRPPRGGFCGRTTSGDGDGSTGAGAMAPGTMSGEGELIPPCRLLLSGAAWVMRDCAATSPADRAATASPSTQARWRTVILHLAIGPRPPAARAFARPRWWKRGLEPRADRRTGTACRPRYRRAGLAV